MKLYATAVIPSCRFEQLNRFLSVWRDERGRLPWHTTIIVWDGDVDGLGKASDLVGKLSSERERIFLYSQDDAKAVDPDYKFLSRGSSACRNLGYLKAIEHEPDFILTLDDDCHPVNLGTEEFECYDPSLFVSTHFVNMLQSPLWVSTVPGHHLRGLPYCSSGYVPRTSWQVKLDFPPVMLSVGLWRGTPDLDAVHQLVRTNADMVAFKLPEGVRLMHPDQFWPMSSMNMMFHKYLLPIMYMPPMGPRAGYDRFEDIWCGVLAQRVMRHLGLRACVGEPFVNHTRMSNMFINLQKEAKGLQCNEILYDVINAIEMKPFEIRTASLTSVKVAMYQACQATIDHFRSDSQREFFERHTPQASYFIDYLKNWWATGLDCWLHELSERNWLPHSHE